MSTVKSTNGAGWVSFAAAILLVNGIFSAVQGLAAIIGPDAYYAVVNGSLLLFDVEGWGWWNLIVGILLVVTAISLFSRRTWARVVAFVLVVVNAIVQIMLLPAQPFWSLIAVAINVLIIYALTVHGDEV